jgi:hypothetical protein
MGDGVPEEGEGNCGSVCIARCHESLCSPLL